MIELMLTRNPVLLGILLAAAQHFDYGIGTLCDWPFNAIRLYRACQRVLRQKYVGARVGGKTLTYLP
jgi:hypothetical protein